jgi:hypothetical protein
VSNNVTQNNMVQLLRRLLFGALLGAVATYLFLNFVTKPHLAVKDPETMLAIVAGLTYALMGVFVGFGVLAPRSGARFLNVQDADEIQEQRQNLAPSALSCIFMEPSC